MRGASWTSIGLAASLQACFMSNYDLLPEAGAGGGVDAGSAPDAPGSPEAAVGADALPPELVCPEDAGADASGCDGGLCQPNTSLDTHVCTEPCELPSCNPCKACSLFCGQDGCVTNCRSRRYCLHECANGIACGNVCAPGAKCDVDCRDARSCRVTCERGSTCTVYCRDSEQCAVECKPGAHCVLGCFEADAGCDFAECAGPLDHCGGAAFCNSLGCPLR